MSQSPLTRRNVDSKDPTSESDSHETVIRTSSDEEGKYDSTSSPTHDIGSGGVDDPASDFHPPQNQVARMSPTPSIIREATSPTLFLSPQLGSPFVTSSSRGRSRRLDTHVSPRQQEAAERAAREATSRQHEKKEIDSRIRQSRTNLVQSRFEHARSPSPTKHKFPMGYSSRQSAGPLSSPEVAEMEQGLYQGPLGSFQEDSPPRRRIPADKQTKDTRSPQMHKNAPFPLFYNPPPHPPRHPGQALLSDDYNNSTYNKYFQNPFVPPPPTGQPSSTQHHQYSGYGHPPSSYARPYYEQPHSSDAHTNRERVGHTTDNLSSPSLPMDEWGSPPPITFSDSFGDYESDNKAKTPFRMPTEGSNDDSESTTSTPESTSRSLPAPKFNRNPFRSPVDNKKGSASPLYQSSPNLSFSLLDTPGNDRVDFSPMGPTFSNYADDAMSADETFPSTGLTLNRSSSEDEQSYSSPKLKQRSGIEKSPYSEHIEEISSPAKASAASLPSTAPTKIDITSGLQGVKRSPVLSGTRSFSQESPPRTRMSISSISSKSSKVSLAASDRTKTHQFTIRASPVAPSSEVKPRTLWQQQPGSTMRMTLGQVGTTLPMSTQQRTLEDINSTMRAQRDQMQGGHRLIPPSAHPRTHPPYDVYRHPAISHGYYHGQQQPHTHHGLTTPIREPAHGYHSRPMSGSHHPPPMMYSHQSPAAMSSAYKKAAPVTTSTGKENSKLSSTDKKGKCNCKKSKCLKLYCECFAAQLYCQGCNCKDCYNLPDFEHEREKAVKAAIQKNRTAFEPRIAEEHNMGCKCRRSQCLKKYCECFQAGVLCSARCKCVDCMNHADSQKLIDVRRRMKDKKGAEYAMMINHENWKKGSVSHTPTLATASPVFGRPHPIQGPPIVHPSSHFGPSPYARPTYLGPPVVGKIFSPMSINTVTPAFSSKRPTKPDISPTKTPSFYTKPFESKIARESKRSSQEISPSMHKIPSTPVVRPVAEPSSSQSKRQKVNLDEETFPLFGRKNPQQVNATALAVFNFLSKSDKDSAAKVCVAWNKLLRKGDTVSRVA